MYPGQRSPFAPGNEERLVHGARSERRVGARAQEILTAVLEDPQMPQHVRSPAFALTLRAWARAEAIADLLFDWIADQDVETLIFPRAGTMKSPAEVWKAADAHAATLRSKMGMDPVSYARIAASLGLAQQSEDRALGSLASQGDAIVSRREIGSAGSGE